VNERRFDVVGEFKSNIVEVSLEPCGIAVNSQGLIAVADWQSDSIFILDKEGKHLRNVGGHENSDGQLQSPVGEMMTRFSWQMN